MADAVAKAGGFRHSEPPDHRTRHRMRHELTGVLWRQEPLGTELPLVLDSPHSGSLYPEDFGYCCPLPVLRRAEDAYVDELYGAAPEFGATLIAAMFPRSYIDANRAVDDIDPVMLTGPM